jgi:hypothetical protein
LAKKSWNSSSENCYIGCTKQSVISRNYSMEPSSAIGI